jgi:hypothetical protein
MSIEAALRKHQPHLLSLPNVTGVGIGEHKGKPAILVFVSKTPPEPSQKSHDQIPHELEGYPVEVRLELIVG